MLLKIGKHSIGEARPCLVITEAACEHKGSLQDAKRMARVAKTVGADIVKFQLHLPEIEMAPGAVIASANSLIQWEDVEKKP